MRLSVTGHRPHLLGGYHQSITNRLVTLALFEIVNLSPDEVLTGMAQGWDQACAEACFALDVPFAAYIVPGQTDHWPPAARVRYETLIGAAARVVEHGDYRGRNHALARDGDMMLALWNGQPSGAGQTVHFCEYAQTPVRNVWEVWQRDH